VGGGWNFQNPPMTLPKHFQVIVLARRDSRHPFKRITTIPVRVGQGGNPWVAGGWMLNVQPDVRTTYIAKVTGGTLHTGRGRSGPAPEAGRSQSGSGTRS
jgi:hypothetical protein